MDRIESIVVPTDFSKLAEAAGVRAAGLAEATGARIHLVHAVPLPQIVSPYEVSVPGAILEGVRRGAEQRLGAAQEALAKRTARPVTASLAESADPVKAIEQAVEAHDADLVAMGTHGRRGLGRLFLGSVAERALRTLDRPLLAVKEETDRAREPIQRILLAVDFSPFSEQATEWTAGLATTLGATVDLIHVVDPPQDRAFAALMGFEAEQEAESVAREAVEATRTRLEEAGLPVAVHLRRGRAAVVISQVAEQIGCQLVAMGTRGAGNRGIEHAMLGSVAEYTLRMAPCSVLAAR